MLNPHLFHLDLKIDLFFKIFALLEILFGYLLNYHNNILKILCTSKAFLDFFLKKKKKKHYLPIVDVEPATDFSCLLEAFAFLLFPVSLIMKTFNKYSQCLLSASSFSIIS